MNSTTKRAGVIAMASILTALIVSLHSGCSSKPKKSPIVPQDRPGLTIPSGQIPQPTSQGGDIPFMGGVIYSQVIAGQTFIPIEGTFSDGSFMSIEAANAAQGLRQAERNYVIRQELADDLKIIQKSMKVLQINIVPEIGFFSALIPLNNYAQLAEIKGLDHRILINPVVAMPVGEQIRGLKNAHSMSLGLQAQDDQDGRVDTSSFSGLARIGTQEFLDKVKSEIGEDVDGATVNVGVTDTGVTFNHPSFLNAQGKNRIQYMKDFTNEGQIYFANNLKFEAREPSASELPAGLELAQAIVINAEVLVAPVGTRLPMADTPSEVKDQILAVPPELKAAMLNPGSGARLGVLAEEAFANTGQGEYVDLNHNGKNEDSLLAILLPDADVAKSKLFIDMSGRGDFRSSVQLGDFNATKTTQKIYSETPGFQLKSIELPKADGTTVPAIGAAIVGFDPGNHGSHVSGIIAGRKTIANDSEQTSARGVAPNANLMVNRVCANNGGCQATSAIIDLSLAGAEVINMSLGGLSPMNDGYGVQETVINRLTSIRNTLFVISAGNSGPGRQTVGSPSTARLALSVAATGSRKLIERQYQWPGSGKPRTGATADEDFLMYFSSRGPTAAGGFKPNISAPGTQLSAVQLNTSVGSRPGMDVYWGTSMAAPTATGAIALLIDAAKRYNARNPDKALALDAITLHKVVSESAIPFDANIFNAKTGARSHGQYTWIDEGNGMINLVSAWDALKAARDTKLPSAVAIEENGKRIDVSLDYQVRVLRKSPNGQDYTGVESAPIDGQGGREPKFGRGIYLDSTLSDSLVQVQIARRLPASVLNRSDLGDLERQLITTADTFDLETVIHGSSTEWLKAGVLGQLDCVNNRTSQLTVVGPGAVDDFANTSAPSGAILASNLNVCVDRSLVAALPAGDHGALIKAFRVVDGRREAQPSFVVPVYLAVAHATLAGRAGYKIEKQVASFEVNRHYVQIPAGTSSVKITLEVPEAKVNGTVVSHCSGVMFNVLEGGNTLNAPELAGAKGRAENCNAQGATPGRRIISYSRLNPNAGIWDLLVTGRFAFKDSTYKINVEFAKVQTSVSEIIGSAEVLNGTLNVDVLDGSGEVKVSPAKSTMELKGLQQELVRNISQDQELRVPAGNGEIGRTFAENVASVAFMTGGSKGNDIDLTVLECEDAELNKCFPIGSSGGSTDEELVVITTTPGKFYVPVVSGYEVANPSTFIYTESLSLKSSDQGSVKVESANNGSFKIDFALDAANSHVLQSDLFKSGQWKAFGDLTLRSEDGVSLVRIPVKVNPSSIR